MPASSSWKQCCCITNSTLCLRTACKQYSAREQVFTIITFVCLKHISALTVAVKNATQCICSPRLYPWRLYECLHGKNDLSNTTFHNNVTASLLCIKTLNITVSQYINACTCLYTKNGQIWEIFWGASHIWNGYTGKSCHFTVKISLMVSHFQLTPGG